MSRTSGYRQRAEGYVRAGARRITCVAQRRGRLGVLAYHSVSTPVDDPWDLAVSPQHFDEQVGALVGRGQVMRLDDALRLPMATRLAQRRPVYALTFDDGYVDNLERAVPILERHDAPATVFVATGLLGQPGFWWDVLSGLAFASGASPEQLVDGAATLGLIAGERRAALADANAGQVHDEIYEGTVRLAPDRIMPMLHELASRIGVATPPFGARPVSTDELLELASHPLITIGVHTVNHQRLTLLSDREMRAELVDATRHLNELLGSEQRPLAYPFGAESAEAVEVARSVGFTHAVTTSSRWVGLREDLLTTPRLHARDLGHDEFTAWLSAV